MMNPRFRLAALILLMLVLANIGWRVWSNRGLVTVDADNAPLSQVIRRVEKQAGVTLVSNAGPDATVTMHVRRVPLRRALQVLAINTGSAWSVGYVLGPDRSAIRGLLDAYANGGDLAGWKKFSLSLPGMPGLAGSADPREDHWAASASNGSTLHAYLEQGAELVDAQFWAPAEWNPGVASAPAAGSPARVVRRLASAVKGKSAEVFFLARRAGPPTAVADASGTDAPAAPQDGSRPGPPPGAERGGPDPAAGEALARREQARIERLPAAKRAEAQAKFDERKKFFEEMKDLTPEERHEKMQARIEEDMRTAGPSPFETHMTQRDAMHTAEQRANFFRMVVKFKEQGK